MLLNSMSVPAKCDRFLWLEIVNRYVMVVVWKESMTNGEN